MKPHDAVLGALVAFASPPRSCGGPIEALDPPANRTRRTPLHRVHAVAPLKPGRWRLRLPGRWRSPPRSCGGPIEARSWSCRCGRRGPPLHRVHAVAPLKQHHHAAQHRRRVLPLHRVHAVAPLKRTDIPVTPWTIPISPPRSCGGPIEAWIPRRVTATLFPLSTAFMRWPH